MNITQANAAIIEPFSRKYKVFSRNTSKEKSNLKFRLRFSFFL